MLQKIAKVLDALDCNDRELSVLLTDDAFMADLNHRYRGKTGPTNVMAFPMGTVGEDGFVTPMLGDVVISVDTARREAAEAGEPLEATIDRLLVHGILHLLGYDHETTPQEGRAMRREEERLRGVLKESQDGTSGC